MTDSLILLILFIFTHLSFAHLIFFIEIFYIAMWILKT